MSIDRDKIRGFTLLEIMLAVTILGMMSLAIYRFVQSNLTAMYLSADTAAADAQYDGLRDLLAAQWQTFSPTKASMKGQAFKLNDRERDEMNWTCPAGVGLLTRYAPGDFSVTLRLQPAGNGRLNLGFLRKPREDSDIGEGQETWVPLIPNVTSLEIRYFNQRANSWVNAWPGGSLPALVKIAVGRADSSVPWEAIVALRRTPY
ncbi:MAG TPA: prepilin-type N-terminal cleavage/methylation domain-containing protein [Candidatus Udaeobacter sp.]|jgi:prepilin-type N-terminal cleavage/methylation domain-containing protein|nr:prepilin-type N-terminal cleavage/methylation domain-containing protein [Candidatus Udaeobacter sp.]